MRLALVLLCGLLACGSSTDDPSDALAPLCNGILCDSNEICVAEEGEPASSCHLICANQLHCWSGCCLPSGVRNYNVCKATELCYGPRK